jgi:hypothetical protein
MMSEARYDAASVVRELQQVGKGRCRTSVAFVAGAARLSQCNAPPKLLIEPLQLHTSSTTSSLFQ